MKRLVLFVSLFSIFQSVLPYEEINERDVLYVWICTGSEAYAYHLKRNCSGLNRCRSEIKNITLHDAINEWHRGKCRKLLLDC